MNAKLKRKYVRSVSLETADLWPLIGAGAVLQADTHVDMRLSNRTSCMDDARYEVTLDVTVLGTWNGRGIYKVAISEAGIFELPIELSDLQRKAALNVACSDILFRDVCEIVIDVVRHAGFPTPSFPAVSFERLYSMTVATSGSSDELEPLRVFWDAHTRLARALDFGLCAVNGRPIASEALAVTKAIRDCLPLADSLLQRLPSAAWALSALAALYVMSNEYGRAVPVYQRTAALWPQDARAHYNLGTSLMFSGNMEEAAHEIRACLSLQPTFWDAYVVQTKLRGYGGTPRSRVAVLKRLIERNISNRTARQRLHMALGMDYEDGLNYDAAFEQFVEGNNARREAVPYNAGDDAELFEALGREREVLDHGYGYTEDAPIFIVGMPRSGTTLVERILSSHQEVASAGEVKQFGLILKEMSDSRTRPLLDLDTISRVHNLVMAHDVDWQELGRRYIELTKPVYGGKRRFIDKLPQNFLYVPYILAALPNARIINVRRGAMDTCLSNFREEFANDSPFHAYASSIRDIGRYYILYDKLMRHWKSLFVGRILEVSYESMAFDIESVAREMLGFLELEWDPACVHFEANQSPVSTASAVQVRRPVYRSSVGRWRCYAAQLESLAAELRGAGVQLGA